MEAQSGTVTVPASWAWWGCDLLGRLRPEWDGDAERVLTLRGDPCSAVGSGWRFPLWWELLEGITFRHSGPAVALTTLQPTVYLPCCSQPGRERLEVRTHVFREIQHLMQAGPGRWMDPLLCTEGARSCLHHPPQGKVPS